MSQSITIKNDEFEFSIVYTAYCIVIQTKRLPSYINNILISIGDYDWEFHVKSHRAVGAFSRYFIIEKSRRTFISPDEIEFYDLIHMLKRIFVGLSARKYLQILPGISFYPSLSSTLYELKEFRLPFSIGDI